MSAPGTGRAAATAAAAAKNLNVPATLCTVRYLCYVFVLVWIPWPQVGAREAAVLAGLRLLNAALQLDGPFVESLAATNLSNR